MKITGKRSIAGILKTAIEVILIINLIVLVLLPLILQAIYANPGLAERGGYSEAIVSGNAEEAGSTPQDNIRESFFNEIPEESYLFMLLFLYASGGITAYILILLRKILNNLAHSIILDRANAGAFRRLSYACFLLVAAFIVKMIFYNSFLTMFCFFVFIVIAMFSLVLSEVFSQGAVMKEENELTI
ncbi:MAG: DUF2975 domain-containing protein [Saccharofermentanales bacterium]